MTKYSSLNKLSFLALLSIGAIPLSGCDSFRNTFGLDHYQPDEFKVSDNPPLSIPKDYRLRPPSDGQSNNSPAASINNSAQAQNLLLGTNATNTAAGKGSSEQSLLSMASAQHQAAPNIRETVNKEAAVSTNVSDSLIQRIMGWREEAARNIASIKGDQPASQVNSTVNEQKVN